MKKDGYATSSKYVDTLLKYIRTYNLTQYDNFELDTTHTDEPDMKEIPVDSNPYKEPELLVKLGSSGEGARWVQWYLWKFGLLLTDGKPDSTKLTGYINEECEAAIKESQRRLGLTGKNVDGIVGVITCGLYKKVC